MTAPMYDDGSHARQCPSCGYCPHCGRRDTPQNPWTWPYQRPYVWYGTTSGSGTSASFTNLTPPQQ